MNKMNDRIPESITQEEDLEGISFSKIKFYREDVEKMKNMSDEEALAYKAKLIDDERFILE